MLILFTVSLHSNLSKKKKEHGTPVELAIFNLLLVWFVQF